MYRKWEGYLSSEIKYCPEELLEQQKFREDLLETVKKNRPNSKKASQNYPKGNKFTQ